MKENLVTPITRVTNHVDLESFKLVLDLQAKSLQIECTLGNMSASGEFVGTERISMVIRQDEKDSFRKIVAELLPDNDAVANPHKNLRTVILRVTKEYLAVRYGLDPATL